MRQMDGSLDQKKVLSYCQALPKYKAVNAYTLRPSWQQIMLLLLVIYQNIVHLLQVFTYQFPYLSLALHYSSLFLMLSLYCWISWTDPVDRLIINTISSTACPPQSLTYCIICDHIIQKTSYHCWRCGRCTEDFDHHCKFINSCIGGRNYNHFLVLIFTFCVYNINLLIRILEIKEFTGFLYLQLLITILLGMGAIALTTFHIYLICYAKTTTYAFLETEEKDQKYQESKDKVESQFEPVTEERCIQK